MKLLIIATALGALSFPAAQASSKEQPVNPKGPEPYHAVDPVYAAVKHEASAPIVAYLSPTLFLKGDEANVPAAGPQPYSAPDPVYR